MSTLLIQTLFMNGRDKKVGNKAESYVCKLIFSLFKLSV